MSPDVVEPVALALAAVAVTAAVAAELLELFEPAAVEALKSLELLATAIIEPAVPSLRERPSALT